jgi:hypothetical protein
MQKISSGTLAPTVSERTSSPGGGSDVGGFHRTVVVNESVVGAEIDDESVLLNAETGIYFGLDAVGTQIWRLLGKEAGTSEIFDLLLAEYDVEPTQLRSDLAQFMDLLIAKDLVRVVEG